MDAPLSLNTTASAANAVQTAPANATNVAGTAETNTPNLTFANDLREDRLRSLIWAAFILAGIGIWLVITTSVVQQQSGAFLAQLPPFLLIGLGGIISLNWLKAKHTRAAMWSLGGGLIGAVAAYMISSRMSPSAMSASTNLFIFSLPITIFIIGLIGRPRDTVFAALLSIAVVVGVPAILTGSFATFGGAEAIAIFLILISSIASIAFTGDLYQITDWALYNYSRERGLASQLYDSRQELEKSFVRAQVLADDLQQANAELNRARTAAEEAKRYRGQFLANMSHELRTPLNAIIGFSETMLRYPMMYDDVKLPDAYRDDMNQIFTSGRQLLTLINDILDLAKVDAGKLEVRMEAVDLGAAIQHVSHMAAGLIGNKAVQLLADVPPNLPMIYADPSRVNQVLINLYSNAAKFTTRGHIRIFATVEQDDQGRWVHVSVEDTGVGIAPHSLETIFEEFRQVNTDSRDPRQGSGLGLSISRQLMKLMGGLIWAESTLGSGSTFHLRLACYDPARHTDARETGTMPATRAPGNPPTQPKPMFTAVR